MKRLILLLVSVVLCCSLRAQWVYVGKQGISKYPMMYTCVMVNPVNQMPYVAFSDGWRKATVMRYNGTDWENVGSPSFSDGIVDCISLAFDKNGTPFVAFMDGAHGDNVAVMSFNGTSWVYIGKASLQGIVGSCESIIVDSKGIPLVAFRDKNNGYKASVMRYDGTTWDYVGTPGFSTPAPYPYGATYLSLAIDKQDSLYVAYSDDINYGRATVQKFNGSTWEFLGTPSFAGWNSQDSRCLVIDSHNRPVLACQLNGKVTVMRFEEGNWIPVGKPSFSQGGSEYTCIAIDKLDNIYVAYQDYGVTRKASVMWYNGKEWSYLGDQGFTPASTEFTSIDVKNDGTVYVAYADGSMNPKWQLSIMEYDNKIINLPPSTSVSSQLFEVFPNPTGNAFTILYGGTGSIEITVSIHNQLGQEIIKKSYPAGQKLNEKFDLSEYRKGIYFIHLYTGLATEVRKVVIE